MTEEDLEGFTQEELDELDDSEVAGPLEGGTPETEILDILKARAQNAPTGTSEAITQALGYSDDHLGVGWQYYHERPYPVQGKETRVRRLLNAFDSTVTWRNIAILWTVALILWLVDIATLGWPL